MGRRDSLHKTRSSNSASESGQTRRSFSAEIDWMNEIASAAWHRACDCRDPRFDGVFYVGITSTHIYCRPVCPSRRARPERRRFFLSARDAEAAGFRPCRRCRPDLARGKAPVDVIMRLARTAADRIGDGALNGRAIGELATELGVSDRQLRRAIHREFGVAPRDLAGVQRLSRARRMLLATSLPVIQVAYTSGFQSLRRFNTAFRERYRMSPTELRRAYGSAKRQSRLA